MSAAAPVVCLASASPRRRELLAQIGISHIVHPAHIDETRAVNEAPRAYVLRMAREKAARIWPETSVPVLAADTSVVVDDKVYGKPADREEALAMLAALSGRAHEVITAVALASKDGVATRTNVSTVRFRAMTAAERAWYWETGEPWDKAGAYAIQGHAAMFVEELCGSYSGVMGLPLFETAELLRAAGLLPFGGESTR